MRLTLRLFVLSQTIMGAAALASPISLTLASSLIAAGRGSTVTFTGTVAELGGTTTFLNGDTVTIAAPLTTDDTKFLVRFPATLTPFQSVTGPMFDVTVPGSAGFGVYPGTFSILGGSGPAAQAVLASQTFAVNVVPEPATGWLLMAGFGLPALWRAARRRR